MPNPFPLFGACCPAKLLYRANRCPRFVSIVSSPRAKKLLKGRQLQVTADTNRPLDQCHESCFPTLAETIQTSKPEKPRAGRKSHTCRCAFGSVISQLDPPLLSSPSTWYVSLKLHSTARQPDTISRLSYSGRFETLSPLRSHYKVPPSPRSVTLTVATLTRPHTSDVSTTLDFGKRQARHSKPSFSGPGRFIDV